MFHFASEMFRWRSGSFKGIFYCAVLIVFLLTALLSVSCAVHAAVTDLPRLQMSTLNMEYQGAFRIKNKIIGDSRIAYTTGEFALTPGASSFYIVGHLYNLAVAEYAVPNLGVSAGKDAAPSDVPPITDLPMAVDPTQPYVSLIPKAPSGNPDGLDRLTGLEYTSNGKLVVNYLRYYDAAALTSDSTLVVDNPSSLNTSKVYGFQKLENVGHVSGWASKVPSEWWDSLGTRYLFGFASNYAINSRSSMGPSAFAVDMSALLAERGSGKLLKTVPFIDYPLDHRLRSDAYNTSGTNDMWTEISIAKYGFIVPGTRTYMVIGTSGGHENGIGYKITQNNGARCGGPCAKDYKDYYNYVWMWDVNDLVAVKEGRKKSYEVEPYDHGKLKLPYQPPSSDQEHGFYGISGADYDEQTRLLFLLLSGADYEQGPYERAPLMLVYRMPDAAAVASLPVSPVQPSPPKIIDSLTVTVEKELVQ